MGAYLIDNPPKRDQFRTTRRARPTGCIVVHTAETTADFTPPDSAAENVANFIRTRTTAGSYHDLADSDSIIQLVPYDYEAYGDATGSNRFATHVSGAVQAGKWDTYPKAHADAVVKKMAAAAARQAKWVKAKYGITVPAKRITKAESDAGLPGFISHGDRDPATRSDPGRTFNWVLFLSEYSRLMNIPPVAPTAPKPKPVATTRDIPRTKRVQIALETAADGMWGNGTDALAMMMRAAARGAIVNKVQVQKIVDVTPDGIWGPMSKAALVRWVKAFQAILGVAADGAWGPNTDAAFTKLRNANRNKF